MPKSEDPWVHESDLPSWGRIYGGLVKLPDDTILRVYIQMGEHDVELVEATIAVFEENRTMLQGKSYLFPGEPLSTKELAQKITIDGRELSIRQHICETIIPYYKRSK